MQQREGRQIVSLCQREGGARHFKLVVLREITDQRAGCGGFACAEIAGQGDNVACAEQEREISHELAGGSLVGQRRVECRGIAHSAAWRKV